jgi:DNA-binding GntR family transcriptional regulator
VTTVQRVQPVRRLTLADDAYESVKALVMDHALAPGDRVSIDGLARQLDVSPTPVREALARLEADGLVRKRPMAGYTVSPLLTRGEFEELFEMRLLLECAAAEKAAGRASTEVLRRLATSAPLPDVSTDTGYAGYAAFTAADARFHDRVARASGNHMLREAFSHLHAHLHLHRLNFPASHLGISGAEHLRIVEAITAGDGRGARAAMRAHLAGARARHLPYFKG